MTCSDCGVATGDVYQCGRRVICRDCYEDMLRRESRDAHEADRSRTMRKLSERLGRGVRCPRDLRSRL